jgi:ribonucleotide reductase beta subunit family protein with ferritin-like domain
MSEQQNSNNKTNKSNEAHESTKSTEPVTLKRSAELKNDVSIKNDVIIEEQVEPLLDKKNFRFTIKPYDRHYEILWKLYKKQQESQWTAEEIDFSQDYDDFLSLSHAEQHFVKMVLAFFSASDGIVNFNLRERFLQEIQVVEAQVAYGYQLMMENVHGEIYSDMLINIVRDVDERKYLFNAIETVPSVKRMSDWALEWVGSDAPFDQRLIAFAIVEGVFFSGAFAAIFWLKKQRGAGKLFMEGLIKSNRFIARDEGLHATFACALHSYVVNKVPYETVKDMFSSAVEISNDFVNNAIKVKLLGMSADAMNEYVQYVSDRLLVMLGYEKMYNVKNPFGFMESIGLHSKDNFFETRPDAYQKSHNENNKDNWQFTIVEDF